MPGSLQTAILGQKSNAPVRVSSKSSLDSSMVCRRITVWQAIIVKIQAKKSIASLDSSVSILYYISASKHYIYNFLFPLQHYNRMQNNPFAEIFKHAHHVLYTYKPKQKTIQQHLQTHPLLQKLNSLQEEHLHLPALNDLPAGIYARTPIQKHKIRISLYYMTAGQTMTLHNHPSMIIMSYVLRGNIEAKHYTVINNEMVFRKQSQILGKGSLSCIDGLRSMQRNLHQFRAIQNSLFLDIVCPDYDQGARLCRYFKEESQVGDNLYKLREIEDTLMLHDL